MSFNAAQWLLRRFRHTTDAPAKPLSRGRRRFNAVFRYVNGFMIVGGCFGVAIALLHNDLLFILLPTGLSVVFWAITMRARIASFYAFLFTAIVSLAYFAVVTGFELWTHSPQLSEIIIVTTTLAVALVLEPVRALVQSVGEQRFHLIEDPNARIVDEFTAGLREVIDLDKVRTRFIHVVQQTMRPRSVALWLRDQPPDPTSTQSSAPFAHPPTDAGTASSQFFAFEMAKDDPLASYALAHPTVMDLTRPPLDALDSEAIQELKSRGAELALPLVSQGELMGMLALGPRLDSDDYSRDDRRLLMSLAAQVTPALRVAQMVRAEQIEFRRRERIEQELRTAQQIQRAFLPREVPTLTGWQVTPYYEPAREVGGDFYDLLPLPGSQLGLVIGDVTGKGMPAALLMTATRTMMRTAAQEDAAPARVLARVNQLLAADVPSGIFVTAFFARLELDSGRLTYANAGQDYPLLRHADGTLGELRATGMPLGLMADAVYDECEATVAHGDGLLFFSDGLVEAHNAGREMFGQARLASVCAAHADGAARIAATLDALRAFTGPDWEQEDDLTLIALDRTPTPGQADAEPTRSAPTHRDTWQERDTFSLPSAPGNEREAIARVTQVANALGLAQRRLEDLQTAVGEATMNAMEHGNHYDPTKLVTICVRTSAEWLSVLITDHGDLPLPPLAEAAVPDLQAKLAGTQSPRGWGLFLIRSLVDELRVTNEADAHTIELMMRLAT